MSDNQNFGDYGQLFLTEIEKAINSGNFNDLNRLVKETVSTSVKSSVKEAADQVKKAADATRVQSRQAVRAAQEKAERERQAVRERQAAQARQAANAVKVRENTSRAVVRSKMPVLFRKKGEVSGTVMQVFGWLGSLSFGIPALVFIILAFSRHVAPFVVQAAVYSGLTACFAGMIARGKGIRARFRRSERYYKLSQRVGYVNVKQLAEAVGRKEKFVVKELKSLISKGTFPQGHLDGEGQCFMLTDDTFHEYQRVSTQRAQIEADQARQVEEDKQREALEQEMTPEQRELQEMIREGRDYIFRIREKNDELPHEVFSQKLFRMEALLKEIFANLEKRPEQMPKMYRLMNYYLPTTLKLVTAYVDFEHMSVQGEDVISAKKEIENTVDVINDAFGELLNQLFTDTAMDVTTDAQVLKTMLAREGLTQDEMTKGGKEHVY